MKPWFEKEADIIPFPKKPERQVIKMPSVSEYPDFITGVLDLQARRDKGQFGKDSYNKLYQDLIHRFMKKESFDTPWFLREDTAEQTVDQLEKVAQQDPKKADVISKAFDKVLQFTNNLLGQKPQQTENTAQVAQQADLIQDQIMQLKKLGDFKNVKKLETFFNNFYQQVQQVGFEKRIGVRQELAKAINIVAGKVNGTLEELEKIYKAQKETGDPNVVIKTSPGADAIRSDITNIVRGLIEKYRDNYKTEEEFNKFNQMIMEFLTASREGIVPLGALIKMGSGNIITAVNKTKFKPLVDNGFITELLKLIPGKTSGNWGPGELGLAILGSPVSKGDKGDIMVGDEKIELKASNNPKKGGRIGSSIVKAGMAGMKEYQVALDKFLKAVGQKRNGRVIKFGDQKPVNALNVNSNTWIKTINPMIVASKVSADVVKTFLKELSEAALNVPESGKINFDYSKAIGKDNQIIFSEFYKEYLRVIMAYYNQVEGVGKILIIRPQNGNFDVINATDVDDVIKKLKAGKLATGTTLINFSDSQAKLSPQIGVN